MEHYKLFINGEFVNAADGKTFESIDPGTETPIATVAQAGKADAEAAIAAARKAFDSGVWSNLTPVARMAKMQDFADQIAQQGLRLAATECMDSGQIIGLAKFGPLLGIGFLRNLSLAAATKFPWEEEIPISGNVFAPGRDFIRREPIGVCVGIIPWNFPMTMAFWKIAPALTMGNTVVLKPASYTPLSALIIAEASKAAGIPDGVVNVIAGPGGELGKTLCTHPDVDKIAFTGSTEVGREIMRMASETIKKVTLELGGKSANIILDDADMDLAVEGACFGTFFHQGQICESGTRVLVSAKIYDEFLDKMKKRTEALRIGYQMDPNSHMGPLVSKQQLATVERYVKIGKEEGAKLITGGKRVEVQGIKGGYYYAPTIFADVNNKMRIAQEEIFGPVVCVIKFAGDEEAIAIANDSIYGLGGGVFSSNTARAERVAREVRTGTMWINNYHIFADFCPFGGYKQSGLGRELGLPGLHEYTQVKRIHVAAIADHKANMTFQLMSDYKKVDGFSYNCPTAVIAGHGALSAIYKSLVDLGCRRALILTDPGVRKAGLADLVKDALVDFCVGIYDKIPADPDLASVDAAVEAARKLTADCIVSVGGGSVIDTAKGVCVTLKNGGKANDHLNLLALTEPQTPHIAIPTTAGTGSEVTNVAVLTSTGAGRKLFIADTHIMPNTAILDPRFTMTLPKELSVSTAMDALTHAIEAMTSTMANKICDGQALQAIRLINENLPLVVADGKNEKARLNLQIAATLAGWAFTIAQVGLAHGMAHTIGTLHHVPHGAACGIVLPKVMRYNVDHAADKLALVAQVLGVDTAGMNEREAALAAADAVEALLKKVGHPTRLRDVGVQEENLPICAFHAIADTAVLFNGRPVNDPTEVLEIYKQAF
ncbi:MAG: aldehyde dehydrogenase [Deltaproteobacteria bacterium RBG_16_54_11]|nr:MAG: aldehyde dehydrogenase [Deltaproteobacteria bacterium RBG_16_54_11]